ncbi:MAG: hypothetical protein FJ098_08830, partial [Deltaproteobacteria bacterium]|nr:hypothetical protein [Deltaproteobacteria bacterium]
MRRYPGPAELLWTLLILSPACGGGEPGSGLAPDNRTPDVALDAPGPDAGLDAEQDTPGDPGTDTTPETGVEAGGDAVVYPDPAFIHMVGGPALASAQDPWTTDEPVQLRTAEVLGDLDVRCLSAAGDRVWAGTATGLFRWDEEAGGFEEIPLVEGTGPVVDLSERLDGWGRLVLLRAHRVIWMDPDSGVQVSAQVPDQDLTALTVAGGWTWVGTANHGIWGAPPGPGLDGTVVLAGSGGAGPVVDLAGTEAGGIH